MAFCEATRFSRSRVLAPRACIPPVATMTQIKTDSLDFDILTLPGMGLERPVAREYAMRRAQPLCRIPDITTRRLSAPRPIFGVLKKGGRALGPASFVSFP